MLRSQIKSNGIIQLSSRQCFSIAYSNLNSVVETSTIGHDLGASPVRLVDQPVVMYGLPLRS